MSLSFVSPTGSVERRWIEYAALRDNVQHHLEAGVPSGQFPNLHRITEALGGREVELSASALHAELTRAQVLLDKPIAELAISQRTRSVVELQWPPPPGANTTLLAATGNTFMLEGREKVLGDFFGVLLGELLRITTGASAADKLRVHDV